MRFAGNSYFVVHIELGSCRKSRFNWMNGRFRFLPIKLLYLPDPLPGEDPCNGQQSDMGLPSMYRLAKLPVTQEMPRGFSDIRAEATKTQNQFWIPPRC
jgi:hypothetical protein